MNASLVGYARTSTLDQVAGYEAQISALEKAGCHEIFREQVSATGKRPELDATLRYIRKGDTLVVTKLDRLARSVKHLGEVVETLDEKEAMLRILNLSLDTGTPTGKLMLNMLGSVAQFEREMMLERQREGIARAKADGKFKGRPRSTQPSEVLELVENGMSVKEVMANLSISRPSYYRLLKEAKDETNNP
ncbi:MAG: recombinase family protein [Pseudomonadales bacterium]|nr:recombinase family protein [Pseudomonadales bacterium]MBO6594605.1 recombinase family protein [Pseudomonadales bacterium]MBO6821834.1 recombinase family protein [Pseudomonadales bacterium]